MPQNGVPQGTVLSLTLFNAVINDLPNVTPPSTSSTLIIYDFYIFVSCNETDPGEQIP